MVSWVVGRATQGCLAVSIAASDGCSQDIDEDAVVVGGHSPVLAVVVLVWIVLLVVGEESIE